MNTVQAPEVLRQLLLGEMHRQSIGLRETAREIGVQSGRLSEFLHTKSDDMGLRNAAKVMAWLDSHGTDVSVVYGAGEAFGQPASIDLTQPVTADALTVALTRDFDIYAGNRAALRQRLTDEFARPNWLRRAAAFTAVADAFARGGDQLRHGYLPAIDGLAEDWLQTGERQLAGGLAPDVAWGGEIASAMNDTCHGQWLVAQHLLLADHAMDVDMDLVKESDALADKHPEFLGLAVANAEGYHEVARRMSDGNEPARLHLLRRLAKQYEVEGSCWPTKLIILQTLGVLIARGLDLEDFTKRLLQFAVSDGPPPITDLATSLAIEPPSDLDDPRLLLPGRQVVQAGLGRFPQQSADCGNAVALLNYARRLWDAPETDLGSADVAASMEEARQILHITKTGEWEAALALTLGHEFGNELDWYADMRLIKPAFEGAIAEYYMYDGKSALASSWRKQLRTGRSRNHVSHGESMLHAVRYA